MNKPVNSVPEVPSATIPPLPPSSPTTASAPPNPGSDASETSEPALAAPDGDPRPIEPPNCPFPETDPPPAQAPCSYNQCLSGHIWPAILALAKCPGCTGGVLAVQKTNCPFCNEPITRTVLRSDFVPRGGGVIGRCLGQTGMGETLDIEMVRTEWKSVEGTTRTFLEQEAQEQKAPQSTVASKGIN